VKTVRTTGLVAFGLLLVVHNTAAPAQEASANATYDCGRFAPAAQGECRPGNGVIAELVRAADEFRRNDLHPSEATRRQMVLAAINSARSTIDPGRLSLRERIVTQNAALRIARTVATSAWPRSRLERELLREASRMVAWLALEPGQLPTEGPDDELDYWLGPRSMGIEERVDPAGPALAHEEVHRYTRAFRMVRVGDRRFLFSQLVAIDTSWRPHVTLVIGDIEMRSDTDAGQRACIAKFDVALARCGAPSGLRVLDPPIHHLFFVSVDAAGRANCHVCHRQGRAVGRAVVDLAPADVERHLRQRRTSLLTLLRKHLPPIRRAAATSRWPISPFRSKG
jgi:hypothetical protein